MAPFKDNPALANARLSPTRKITEPPDETAIGGRLARVHNRIGGLLERLSKVTGIAPQAALAVWYVESAGAAFRKGRPILRFETHIFFSRWGKDNAAVFDAHFQCGGRNGVIGKAWEQQKFRTVPEGEWRGFHGDQTLEYEVFNFAARLAGREAACLTASFGGPQIMGFNYTATGYDSATELFQAFARSERWQVCGFFDFCRAKGLIDAIRGQRWHDFATVYNGPGNAAAYEALLAGALDAAGSLS